MHTEQKSMKPKRHFLQVVAFSEKHGTTTQDDLLAIHFCCEAYHYVRLFGMVVESAASGDHF